MLTEKEIARIREEAEREARLHFNPEYSRDSWQACVSCYVAAVIKEREREREKSKVLLDGLQEIIDKHAEYQEQFGENRTANHLRNIAFETLVKYKNL